MQLQIAFIERIYDYHYFLTFCALYSFILFIADTALFVVIICLVVFNVFVLQRIHDLCRLPVSLFNRHSTDSIPLPYNVPVCRKALYQLLLTLLMSSFSWKPSPDQVLVKTFSLGVNDKDIEVFLLQNFIVDRGYKIFVAFNCLNCLKIGSWKSLRDGLFRNV